MAAAVVAAAAAESCLRSPLLAAWAGAVTRLTGWVCHLLELEGCRPLLQPCQECVAAGWLLSLCTFLLAAALLVVVATRRVVRWLSVRDGSRMVTVAAEVLGELRRAQPAQYPAQRHMFAPAPGTSDPLTPLLCAVCHGSAAAGAPGAATLQCCFACGLLTHDGCARRAGKTCRPLCCSSEQLPHFWQAVGTIQEAEAAEGGSGAGPTCIYCSEPAENDLLVAAEPLWRCSLCAGTCHVQCFCDAHPELPAVGAKLGSLLAASSNGKASGSNGRWIGKPAVAANGQATAAATAAKRGASSSGGGSSSSSDEGTLDGQRSPVAASQAGGAANGGSTVRHRHSGGFGARPSPAACVAGGSSSGYSSDSESDDLYDARLQRHHWQRRRRRRMLLQDIGRLDECTLGPNRRSVLPPTAVRATLRGSGSSGVLNRLGSEGAAAAAAATAAGEAVDSEQQQQGGEGGARSASPLPGVASSAPARKDGGSRLQRKKSSWWRRLYGTKTLQWQDYRIDQLPPGCKPVLVFVNTKSGPQIGTALRQRFLRSLHPLQVVELPRQKPDAALALFAGVASRLRILVVGGDGSVAWILSCLETLKEEQAARGNPRWKPPPVGVLPLGTGNDLARCLGWGAGSGAWQTEGVGAMLAEVQHAAPMHIDRWNVCFAPPAPPPSAPLTPTGKLASMMLRGHSFTLGGRSAQAGGAGTAPGGSAGGSGSAVAAGAPPVVKQMNNYLGIGVDAKVALEFHQMREQYPFFFTSQLGNKFWYTAVGGKDVFALAGHACVDLAQKIQVVCDGRTVPLPPDMEGLLVLNINSYMGGVDLWRNGYNLPGASGPSGSGEEQLPPSGRDAGDSGEAGGLVAGRGAGAGGAGGGSRRRHMAQSMLDGRVELVAVFGSFHLGQLQIGLSRAARLGQGREVTITSHTPLPMQVDGEPWVQAPAAVRVSRRGQGLMLRRVHSKPLARMMQALSEVLEESEQRGTITAGQHHTLMADLAAKLQPLLLHPS